MEIITNHTLISEVDKISGNIIQQDEFIHKKIPQKARGFRLIYTDGLELLLNNFNSSETLIILDLFCKKLTKKYILRLTYKSLIKDYGINKTKATSIITRLKTLDFLRGNRGRYEANPYLVVPVKCPDRVTAIAQARWNYEE